MTKLFKRSLFKALTSLAVVMLVLGVPGLGTKPALALTTTVDDIPGAAVLIPDAPPSPNCTNRTITVNSGTPIIISDVNVGVNISHLRRSDVRVTLTSPAGTTVVLISGNGLGNPVIASPDDYDNYDVLLDDSSINSLYDNDNDDVAAPFYDRNARPNQALIALKGQNAVGNWTLAICDTRNGEVGTYNRGQLTITSADPNTVTGAVFTDYNDNGVREQGDVGVPGITVTAYNAAGVAVATTTTDANGNYTFAGIADGTQLRIEFTNIPANLRPGAFGIDSGTTVQFVTSPAAAVDLGLAKPDEYCQNNPWLVSPCYINGNPLGGGSAGTADVLVSFPYNAYGRQDNSIENTLATGVQIGATWGLAFQRATGTVFAGALAKRHMGLGPGGAGAIYSLVMNPVTGTGSAPVLFADLATLGIPTGGATLGTNAARGLPATSALPNTDPTGWDAVGKVAIGDIDMGTNDTTLWVMNLFNQTLYAINVGNPPGSPTIAGTFPITSAVLQSVGATACPQADIRPWAVEISRGNVYVGVVCSAESTQNVNNLRAYVLSMSEAAPGTFSLVTDFALNYPRGFVTNPAFVGNPVTGFPAEWRPWSPIMTSLCAAPCASTADLAFGKQIIYPQPILADIEFDTDGDLILGFMDRLGHQTGNANFATSDPWGTVTLFDKDTYAPSTINIPATNPVTTYEGVSAGDTLRLCSNGAGGFILENNATCGGITTGGAGSAPAQGPGGGEYYWQEMHPPSTALNSGIHHETTLGGLLLVPGTNEIAVSVFDPFDLRAGGIAWFNNLTGARTRAYEAFGIDQGGGATTFGKAAGLGDIEGFCFAAPIEIGDRVWLDANNDGIQDAGETPIAGVAVELYDQNGNLIATAITDANGNYFFSSGPGTNTPSQQYGIAGFGPNSQYEVRIPLGQPALAGLTLTIPDAGTADQRDSDGQTVATSAVVPVTTGSPGDNNHTYDFGFTGTYSLGNRVWLDDGTGGGVADNGIQDGTEVGIGNVVVNLYRDDNGDNIPDGPAIATTTTDANGHYRFDDLRAGGYVVEIPSLNFNSGSPLFSLASSSVDETNPNVDIDRTDNGIGIIPDALNGIRSNNVVLGPPGPAEPTGETDLSPTGQGAPDARANMTVDFGFVPSYSIGNRVWFDTDNDSARDNGVEVGVAGVVVELYSVDALGNFTLVATTTTDANGYYRFDGLPAGDYSVIIPADNFTPGGASSALVGYWSSGTTINNNGTTSETTAPDADNDLDDDDNGTRQNAGTFAGAVVSSVVTLGPGTIEPTLEADLSPTGQGAIDARANMTVDFGFYRLELGNLVFEDVNNNGTFDAGDVPLQGVRVQLFAADGVTEINVGPDGVLGTADDAPGGMFTDVSGNYLFSGLPQGDYIVRVTGPVGYTSTIDTFDSADNANPNANRDNNDNGIGTGAGVVSSAIVTLTPGSAGALNNNAVNQNNGTTTNPTVDFGFVQANAGIIKTVNPSIATIGQVVTYQVQVLVPPGTYTNAQLVDTMQTGLALFSCQSITGVGITPTTIPCAGNVTTAPAAPGSVDVDRIVTFNLGTLVNAGQVDGTLTVIYEAIVLDIPANRGAATQTTLDNSAVLTWDDGAGTQTLGPVSRRITLIEPDLQIVKSSNTNFVATGTQVDFTLTVTHTANSRADAFDVLVTDVLPLELDYVANSITCTALNLVPGSCTYNAGTRTISGEWSVFTLLPANQQLTIQFSVTGNALLAPGQTITNVGNVQWTSEPGPQQTPVSFSNPPNDFATERFYDPASPNPINTIYGDSDPLVLNPVGGGGGGGGTSPTGTGPFILVSGEFGFAPEVVTPLAVNSKPVYDSSNLTINIPSIKMSAPIVGVDFKDGMWDASWLQDQAGWLEGTAYPTWSGNSVIGGHVVGADGKPGIFYRLKYVSSGAYIYVNNSGYIYTYKVVSNEHIQPHEIGALDHSDDPVLTLITCDRYDVKTKSYQRWVMVRAVLVDVSPVK